MNLEIACPKEINIILHKSYISIADYYSSHGVFPKDSFAPATEKRLSISQPLCDFLGIHAGAKPQSAQRVAFIPPRVYSNLQLYSIYPPYRPFKSVYLIQAQLMHDNCKMHRIPRHLNARVFIRVRAYTYSRALN